MSAKRVNLHNAFRDAMLRNTDASRKESFGYFYAEIQNDPRYLTALAEDYFYRQCANWRPVELAPHSVTLAATPAQEARVEKAAAKRVESKARVAVEVKRLKTVLLMNLTLPTGKTLRESTGAECAKAGGFYLEVSRYLKPTEVVDKHLDEEELGNIYSRFDKRRTQPAERSAHDASRGTRPSA